MKSFGFFKKGRKVFFTLALFILVFAAASVVKIQAAGNVTGWLWGGGEEAVVSGTEPPWDGTNTNVGWISMSSNNPELASFQSVSTKPYNVNIPANDGEAVTGYAWSEYLGWIDFNPQDSHCVEPPTVPSATQYQAADCDVPNPPGGAAGVFRSPGNKLTGWARIVGIAQESANNNSGGWSGWIHMNGSTHGIDLAKMTGDMTFPKSASQMTFATAGADELGWIDFSRAKIPMPIGGQCKTPPNSSPICPGNPNPSTMTASQLCDLYDVSNPPVVTGSWDWICSGQNGGSPMNCHTEPETPVVPQCGINVNFCTGNTSSPCASGSASPFVNEEGYEVSWTCTGSCVDPITTNCTAKAKKSCGWIETNP